MCIICSLYTCAIVICNKLLLTYLLSDQYSYYKCSGVPSSLIHAFNCKWHVKIFDGSFELSGSEAAEKRCVLDTCPCRGLLSLLVAGVGIDDELLSTVVLSSVCRWLMQFWREPAGAVYASVQLLSGSEVRRYTCIAADRYYANIHCR